MTTLITKTKYLTLGVIIKCDIPALSMIWCDIMKRDFTFDHMIGAFIVEYRLLSSGHVFSKVCHKTKALYDFLILDVKLFVFIVVAILHIVCVE